MYEHILTEERIAAYGRDLATEERSHGTIENYLRHVRIFSAWLNGVPVTKEQTAGWKEYLLSQGYAPTTINSMLAALNGLFRFLGWDECRVKFLKVQRRLFRDAGRELSRQEYQRLLDTARTWAGTAWPWSWRPSAPPASESARCAISLWRPPAGQADIALKGKVRTILLPGKLCRKLLKYARQQKTASGEIFLTKSGKPLSGGRSGRR